MSWWRVRWMVRSKDRTKNFMGRYCHFWIGLGIVALAQERMHLGWSILLSLVTAILWEWVAALVAAFWYNIVKYRPDLADRWSPSVGDLLPWMFGALVAGAYWLWLLPPLPATP